MLQMITYEPGSRSVVSVAVVLGAMSSCSSTAVSWSSSTSPSLVGSASGASLVLMITNSWVLGPSFEMLKVTEPDGALLDASSIEKSFSVAETPPEGVPPADELLLDDELAHPTAPNRATATAAIARRVNNRSMDPSPLFELASSPYERMTSPDNRVGPRPEGRAETRPPLEVDAATELGRWLFGPRLHPERQPRSFVPVDPDHDRVPALRLENETVEVERHRRGSLALGRCEVRLERRPVAEHPRLTGGVEQRQAERVRAGLVGRRAHHEAQADPVVSHGERARLDHLPADAERMQLAARSLHRVSEERVDLHHDPPILARRPSSIRSSPNSNCASRSHSERYRAHAATFGRSLAIPAGKAPGCSPLPKGWPVSIITDPKMKLPIVLNDCAASDSDSPARRRADNAASIGRRDSTDAPECFRSPNSWITLGCARSRSRQQCASRRAYTSGSSSTGSGNGNSCITR